MVTRLRINAIIRIVILALGIYWLHRYRAIIQRLKIKCFSF
jgi:hypothetical protein